MAEPLGRRFWAVWAGSSMSYLAEGLLFGALPVLAATLTRDARLISVTDAVHQTGWLLLGLASGVVADRLPRLHILWVANALRALLAGIFAALVASGQASLPGIYGLGFLLGLAAPFFDNTSSALLPELVPRSEFQRANSLTQASLAMAGSLLGPVLGTAAFVIWPASPFWFAAGAYATGSALTAWLARRDPGRPVHTGDASHRELLVEGLRYLRRHQVLLTLAIATGIANFVSSGAIAVMVLYVLQLLHLPEAAYGWAMASFAVGALTGAALSVRLTKWLGQRRAILVSLAMFGIPLVVLGAVVHSAVAFAAIAIVGFFSMVWNITVNTYRQHAVPLELLGRVTSVYRMLGIVAMPLGALAGGLLTHAIGLQLTYVTGGLILVGAAVVAAFPLRPMPDQIV